MPIKGVMPLPPARATTFFASRSGSKYRCPSGPEIVTF